ncbi:hypothetical protein CDAR_584251 [Caerostris darwini]|uniref:Uncharacterized protein n=1 Tax=Caerostris darwini TaxID=1538125 RepID=A0AAV4VTM8_9ARAC|nr:hypothetical protein CDAR_584251 [Caerostris darwini]
MIYGTVNEPYLLMRMLKELTIDYFPKASSIFRENFYVDDYYVERKLWRTQKSQQLTTILQKMGMKLHMWCFNHPEFSPNSDKNYSFSNPDETKILGVSCTYTYKGLFFLLI